MSNTYFTNFTYQIQDYICNNSEEIEDNRRILKFTSQKKTSEVKCPNCGGQVKGHGRTRIRMYDIPYAPGMPTIYELAQHRYVCSECGMTSTEENPIKAPGFNLTRRCVEWVCMLLSYEIPTNTVAEFMGLHWNTVRKIQKARIDYLLKKHDKAKMESSYRPYYLAVDEFAIHKGHRYATCVMDLVKGEIIWVGKGRAIKDFAKFFDYFADTDYLSQVKAVAMDMNASYNKLVEEHLPNADIVYDRYHVQAQFGRDVLGQVRLEEARKHNERSKILASEKAPIEQIREEKQTYTKIKKARWTLLRNGKNLSTDKLTCLNEILDAHSDLALCYAMKEELVDLFLITDESLAEEKWTNWFNAAIQSNVKPLVKFARQKFKRIKGLVAHARWQINTGKLEGFNNKIKVAKRNAYGFRNNDYFFSYIRYLSCPFGF